MKNVAFKVAPEEATLSAFHMDPTRWKHSPPWANSQLKELKESLFGGPAKLSEKVSLRQLDLMSQRGEFLLSDILFV